MDDDLGRTLYRIAVVFILAGIVLLLLANYGCTYDKCSWRLSPTAPTPNTCPQPPYEKKYLTARCELLHTRQVMKSNVNRATPFQWLNPAKATDTHIGCERA